MGLFRRVHHAVGVENTICLPSQNSLDSVQGPSMEENAPGSRGEKEFSHRAQTATVFTIAGYGNRAIECMDGRFIPTLHGHA